LSGLIFTVSILSSYAGANFRGLVSG
jgi:hypothetical protein